MRRSGLMYRNVPTKVLQESRRHPSAQTQPVAFLLVPKSDSFTSPQLFHEDECFSETNKSDKSVFGAVPHG